VPDEGGATSIEGSPSYCTTGDGDPALQARVYAASIRTHPCAGFVAKLGDNAEMSGQWPRRGYRPAGSVGADSSNDCT
jgi:hypothetical protein